MRNRRHCGKPLQIWRYQSCRPLLKACPQARQNLRKYNAGISPRAFQRTEAQRLDNGLHIHRSAAATSFAAEIIVSDIFVPRVTVRHRKYIERIERIFVFSSGSGSPYNHVFKLLPIQQFDQFEFPLDLDPCTIISTLCTLRPVSFQSYILLCR